MVLWSVKFIYVSESLNEYKIMIGNKMKEWGA